ncbi:hypothetical protein POJ06DRAFT_257662 [Lipomyces tetrasporus]|uniref:Uncharacterized protein n=1 Tax=Lipomyces tetrasporus TaxID=54092 RepID=A0AAD7QNU8_9ASCO|nr:uncharacterized protein POJ06DRAFT_257662 [Lipomyces tetrasporus]KAJ8098671.1 hypothetical protein POJ06DRAFT_257662 [Lipomyces tetrasporus]
MSAEAIFSSSDSNTGAPYPFDPVAECQKLIELRNKVLAGAFPKFSIPSLKVEETGHVAVPISQAPPVSRYEDDYRSHEDGFRQYAPPVPHDDLYQPNDDLKRKREWETEDDLSKRRPSPEYRVREPNPYEPARHVPYSPADHPPPPVPSTASRYDDYRYQQPPPPQSSSYGRPPVPSYYDQPRGGQAHLAGTVQMNNAVLPPGVIVEDGYTRDTQRGYELFIPSAAKKGRYQSSTLTTTTPVYSSSGYNPSYPSPRGPPPTTISQPIISHWPPYAPSTGPSSSQEQRA